MWNHDDDKLLFQSHHENHLIDLFLLGSDTCITFVSVFIACEFGQHLDNSFSEINDLINQLKWYRFPIEMKRILPFALIIVQEPVSIECFGSILCCRETFKKVSVKLNLQ